MTIHGNKQDNGWKQQFRDIRRMLVMDTGSTRLFYLTLLGTTVIRFILAVWLPIIGDEAYFIVWGKHLDYGYYDHTPLVGWLLAGLLSISDAAWWLRLPAVLIPTLLGWFIYQLLLSRNAVTAPWVAMTFLVTPVNVINILITTDTLLILFSFISAWYFYRAVEENKSSWNFVLCGLFLGLAFLSKYFAVLLGTAYGLYILVFNRDRKSLTGLGLILLLVLPFAGINILWNYNHCWNNILFNFLNRTAAAGIDNIARGLVYYFALLVYLFSPPLIYFILRNHRKFPALWQDKFKHVYLWLIVLPLFLFLLLLVLILHKPIGLHWLLSFYPFAFIALAEVLDTRQWRFMYYFMIIFSVVHVIVISSLMLMPPSTFSGKKEAVQNLTFGKHHDEVLAKLAPYEKDYIFASISYSMAAVASYYAKKDFIVIGIGSHHAREDDRLTDFASLDGKNILLFKRTSKNIEQLKPFFKSTEHKTIVVRGATFEILLGNGFNYPKYRREVLAVINKDFYSIPDWLPTGKCEFKSRYSFP